MRTTTAPVAPATPPDLAECLARLLAGALVRRFREEQETEKEASGGDGQLRGHARSDTKCRNTDRRGLDVMV